MKMRLFGQYAAVSLLAFGAGAGMGPFEAAPRHPTQLFVRLDPLMDRSANAQAAMIRAGVLRTLSESGLVPGLRVVEVENGHVDEVVAKLRATPGVLYAEPDYLAFADAQTMPYGISMIQAEQVWPRWGQGGGAVRVAVLDTGVDQSHPDLPLPVLSNSFIATESVEDLNSHGSHCSGTVLGSDNSIGVVGVAPSARLMIGKVLANSGGGPFSGVAAGIDWAVANGARVVSMSLGGTGFSQALSDSCQAALNAGVLVVASAGNNNNSVPSYPGSLSSVMAVAAVDSGGAKAWFSNFGSQVSVAAPGVSVQSTVPVVAWNSRWLNADHQTNPLTGSAIRAVTAGAIDCGIGDTAAAFPAGVSGKIAHIRRSGTNFLVVALNAFNAGAIGVILSNNVPGNFQASLSQSVPIPVGLVSQADGDNLAANIGTTVAISQFNNGHSYANFDGTSMACPHVSGAAGLLIGDFVPAGGRPAIPPLTIRWVLEHTATDAGTVGRDDIFGWGIINVNAAAAYLHGRIRCPGDLNADNMVDDADFVRFVGFYNDLITPGGAYTGGDFDGNGLTDDADFVIFAGDYDALVCA